MRAGVFFRCARCLFSFARPVFFQCASASIDDVSANDSDPPVGVIDRTGKWIVQPKCYRISAFCDGLASARINGECVYFDLNGNVAIRTKSSYANSFSEGLAAVKEP